MVNHTLLRASAERHRETDGCRVFWIITAVANWNSTKEPVVVNYHCCGWTLVNGTCGRPDLLLWELQRCSRWCQGTSRFAQHVTSAILFRTYCFASSPDAGAVFHDPPPLWREQCHDGHILSQVAPDHLGGGGGFAEATKGWFVLPFKCFCIIQ